MPTAARVARPQAASLKPPATAPPAARAARAAVQAATARATVARPLRDAPPLIRLRDGVGQGRDDAGRERAAANAARSGEPLRPGVRAVLEKRLGVDLSGVRVHAGAGANSEAKAVSARAFTRGTDIYLRRGERQDDLGLMAHEAAHVVQQRGAPKVQRFSRGEGDACEREAHRASEAVVRGERFDVRESAAGGRVQRLGFDDILDWLADKANAIPGFRMFTIVIGVNPINMSSVDRSAANILRAVVEFIPGGNLITRALDTYGIFEKVGNWIAGQIESLGMVGSAFGDALSEFIDSLGITDLARPGSVWSRAKRIFTDPVDRLISFVKGFIGGILDFLRDAALRPLAKLAEGTRAYDLLKAVLGKDPITGDPVPQSADVLIGGFMKLIGQEEVWQNLQKARAVPRAFAWFKTTLSGVLAFVRQVPGLIISTLKSIVLDDFLPITNLFAKVGKAFGGFVGSFISWAGGQVLDLLKIIFEVVAPSVMPYVMKAAGAFKSIIKNPGRFVGTLVSAGKQGFNLFKGNFLKHLRKSLIDWLTGTMSGAAIYIPQAFSLPEIIKFALSVLGLTWQNIRQKLVTAVGETAVKAMEGAFDIVMTLVTQGPGAAWEKIQEGISNLQEMVMEQVMSFVKQRVVEAAIKKLLMMLSPAGAFIQAIVAIYNTVMFFVERLSQIGRVVASFIDSISSIAAGNTGTAAKRVETTMAGMLTLVISFLARQAGLGKVSDEVIKIVNRVRAPIDKALDRVVNWIVDKARKLGRFVAQAGVPKDPNERMRLAASAALAAAKRLTGRVTRSLLSPVLTAIRVRYGLTEITPFERGGNWWVRIVINPKREDDLKASSKDDKDKASATFTVAQTVGTLKAGAVGGGSAGSLSPPPPKPGRPKFAYVATVPATPDKSVGSIAGMYGSQGFDSAEDARLRFSLVVGVNSYEDLEGTKEAAVKSAAVAASPGYPVGAFGFLWRPQWKEGPRNIGFEQMKARFASASAADKAAIKASEKAAVSQAVIPMGAIRNRVMTHALTSGFVGALKGRSQNVYIHVGDADAVSLRAVPAEGIRVDARTVATALFARYDQLLSRGRPGEEPPALASGGYRFRVALKGGGYRIDQKTLTTLANDMDMAVRQAMARFSPESIYFPEPNTVIRVQGDDLDGLFSGGGGEGGRMARELLRRRPGARVAFDQRAAIVTDSTRFSSGIVSGTSPVTKATLRDLTAAQLRGMVTQAQSHANPSVWADRIVATYPFGGANAQQSALRALSGLYFPTERFGYEPANLRKSLPTFNPNTVPLPPPGVYDNIAPPKQRATVVNMAKATGTAIRRFLMELLKP